ncbi:MAG TPA: LysE family translocator [Rhodospirillales bacterium]|nr:LysE family translocator [Rhodospirillales bacterium]
MCWIRARWPPACAGGRSRRLGADHGERTSAFSILKLAGGLYLIYLGVQTWRSAGASLVPQPGSPEGNALPALQQGVIVEGTNPKTAAFFLALIPQFIDPAAGSVAAQFVVLGLISVGLNTAMDVVVVCATSAARRRFLERPRILRRLRQASGGILWGLGVTLLLTRRPA